MIDQFSREQFEELLNNLLTEQVALLPKHTAVYHLGIVDGEYSYRIPLEGDAYAFFRSSVDETGYAAEAGKDSIRLWCGDRGGNGLLKKKHRWVARTAGWRTDLAMQFAEMLQEWHDEVITLREVKDSGLRWMHAKYESKCPFCKGTIAEGAIIVLKGKAWGHFRCPVRALVTNDAQSQEGLEALGEFFAKAGAPVVAQQPPEPANKVFKPSKYQLAVFQEFVNGSGHIVIEAVAGSGKSTTQARLLSLIPPGKKAIYLAFNNKIVKAFRIRQAQGEIPLHIPIKTVHSLGLSNLMRAFRVTDTSAFLDEEKLSVIMNSIPALSRDRSLPIDVRAANMARRSLIEQIVRLCKNTMLDAVAESGDFNNLWALIDHYGIEYDAETFDDGDLVLVQDVLQRCADNTNTIDFDDMIWLCVQLGIPLEKFDYILVDEAQDMNRVQIALLLGSVAPGGRIIAVGDRNQSLYGFRGADVEAMDNLVNALQAKQMPLSISYRSPRLHIAMAQELVPAIEAREDAPDGFVGYITERELLRAVKPGDMVICRVNAPLVPVAFALIRKGIKANVIGRDFGKGLIDMVEKFKADSLYSLAASLHEYLEREQVRLSAGEKWATLQMLQDKVETLEAIMAECRTVEEVGDRIKTIFAEETQGVTLCSIHRAKGLENNRVFILRPDIIEHPYAKKEWQKVQERNAHYVALTRSLDEMFFVTQEEGE